MLSETARPAPEEWVRALGAAGVERERATARLRVRRSSGWIH
jgi:hypothetical protein